MHCPNCGGWLPEDGHEEGCEMARRPVGKTWLEKLDKMSDEDILAIWNALGDYDKDTLVNEMSPDQWAGLIYQVASERHLL